LPVPRGDLTSFSPDGTKIAYIESSQELRTWKRYRGGWNLPIAIYDLKKNTYEELPKSSGMDMFPMWHDNTIYFISDREGVMNLYSYDLASKQTKKVTDYKEFDIKWPSLGPDAIVYENGGLLYEFNLPNGKPRNIPIQVHAEDLEARPEFKKRSAKYRQLLAFALRRPRAFRSTRQCFHRAHRARQHSRPEHGHFQRPRTQSCVVARRQIYRVSVGQDWRVRAVHSPPDGRRSNAYHGGWRRLPVWTFLVAR